jgi:hypothetical protein
MIKTFARLYPDLLFSADNTKPFWLKVKSYITIGELTD